MVDRNVGTARPPLHQAGVAGIELSTDLMFGVTTQILWLISNFTQIVDLIHIEHETVDSARRATGLASKRTDRSVFTTRFSCHTRLISDPPAPMRPGIADVTFGSTRLAAPEQD